MNFLSWVGSDYMPMAAEKRISHAPLCSSAALQINRSNLERCESSVQDAAAAAYTRLHLFRLAVAMQSLV